MKIIENEGNLNGGFADKHVPQEPRGRSGSELGLGRTQGWEVGTPTDASSALPGLGGVGFRPTGESTLGDPLRRRPDILGPSMAAGNPNGEKGSAGEQRQQPGDASASTPIRDTGMGNVVMDKSSERAADAIGPEETRKREKEAFQQRVDQLSVDPPEDKWGTITVEEEGQEVTGKIPFTQDEADAYVDARRGFERIRKRGYRSSGRDRDYVFGDGGLFPASLRDNLTLLRDRRSAVSGILYASRGVDEILTHYAGTPFMPEGDDAKDYETLKNLPNKLKVHEPPTTS